MSYVYMYRRTEVKEATQIFCSIGADHRRRDCEPKAGISRKLIDKNPFAREKTVNRQGNWKKGGLRRMRAMFFRVFLTVTLCGFALEAKAAIVTFQIAG